MNRPGVASTSAVAASTGSIERQHAAKRALRIAVEALFGPRRPAMRPSPRRTGLLCLMTDAAGSRERPHDGQRAVEIEQVVVRQLFAVQLLGGQHADAAAARRDIDGALLMRVFAVAQLGLSRSEARNMAGGKVASGSDVAAEPGRDGRVVAGRVGKRRGGQFFAEFERGPAGAAAQQ